MERRAPLPGFYSANRASGTLRLRSGQARETPVAPPALSRLFGKDRQDQPLRVANHRHRAPRADLSIGQQAMEVIDASDRLLIERHDYVALAQARCSRRALVFTAADNHAGLPR